MVEPEHLDFFASKIKNVQIYIFPEGKHNIHLRYSDEFNTIISNFLARVKTKSAL